MARGEHLVNVVTVVSSHGRNLVDDGSQSPDTTTWVIQTNLVSYHGRNDSEGFLNVACSHFDYTP